MSDQPLTPAQRYAADLTRKGFTEDAAQRHAVDALDGIYHNLIDNPPKRRPFGKRQWPQVSGLYLWGGVGRGKTYLMDCFYDALPFSGKWRTHFHRFMLDVHRRRNDYPAEVDPILKVAEDIGRKYRVLCFDEFFVADIADAMILGRLTEALFEHGVTLIATSNVPPDELYKDGLQREQFLPAIDRIKRNNQVLHLDSPTDYRLRALTRAEIFHVPSDPEAEANLDAYFSDIAPEPGVYNRPMSINDRDIKARRQADGVAWFDFEALCTGARSAADYIELARIFHTVILDRVPIMDAGRDDSARRFMSLVDEFYDRNVKLIIAAESQPKDLYTGTRLAFEFERTISRLQEMQSQEYLATPHLP